MVKYCNNDYLEVVMKKKIYVLDSTLRDGMQAEKISFSVTDKLNIIKSLDELSIDYIEAGNPHSNIKDKELFSKLFEINLNNSEIVAFGSTCKVNESPETDEGVKTLLNSGANTLVIFGKAWSLHVSDVLKTTREENLRIISDTIKYLVKNNKKVFFDAEHFFDGYKNDTEYSLKVLKAAQDAGASALVLCDTNGGSFPDEIFDITKKVIETTNVSIGIHCHNDNGMAVANTVMAVKAGATHIQGTLNGIGERCGNANLSTIIANLQLKGNYSLIPDKALSELTHISRVVAEISNISLSNMPYVSKSAFSHKSGMHIDAVIKNPVSFEHINPSLVGNKRNFLISEMSGKSAIMNLLKKIDPELTKESEKTKEVLNYLKELEYQGYQFEAAPASLELYIRKYLGLYTPYFNIERLQIFSELEGRSKDTSSFMMIKVIVDKKEEITAVDSDGPVHAMDMGIRKALNVFFPEIDKTHLTDYKVRVLDSQAATGAKVRVLIETEDNKDAWTTIGVSTDVIEASKIALIDALEYKLLKDNK